MNEAQEVIWEEPESTPRRYSWFWKALQENPGRWARYPGAPNAAHNAIRARKDADCWEATQQGGIGRIRYIGPKLVVVPTETDDADDVARWEEEGGLAVG
jgi:hypothetical protein